MSQHWWWLWWWQVSREGVRRTRNSMSVLPHVLRPPRFHPFTFDITSASFSSKGLEPSVISSIPLFVYQKQEKEGGGFEFDCVICLSGFEENEIGRCLPKCGHGFHVECIDMWLGSHSNCPVCRAPVVAAENSTTDSVAGDGGDGSSDPLRAGVELVEIVVDSGREREGSREENVTISDQGDNRDRDGGGSPEFSTDAEAETALLGCSLKKMLSRKMSDQCCCKVLASSNGVHNLGLED